MAIRTLFWLLPKFQVDITNAKFEITNTLSIRKTPQEILTLPQSNTSALAMVGKALWEEITNSEWSIACDYEDPTYLQSDNNGFIQIREANKKIAGEEIWRLSLLAALKYHVYTFDGYRALANPDGSDAFIETPPSSLPDLRMGNRFWEFRITKPQLLDICTYLDKLKEKLNCKRFLPPVKMVYYSFLGRHFEDTLMLATIAMEMLFTRNHEWNDQQRLLSKRGSCFLGEGHDQIKNSYKVRSNFVHGNLDYHTPSTHQKIKDASFTMMEYACKALVKLIEDDERWEVFVDDAKWDDYLQKLMQDVSDPKKEVKNLKKTVQST